MSAPEAAPSVRGDETNRHPKVTQVVSHYDTAHVWIYHQRRVGRGCHERDKPNTFLASFKLHTVYKPLEDPAGHAGPGQLAPSGNFADMTHSRQNQQELKWMKSKTNQKQQIKL